MRLEFYDFVQRLETYSGCIGDVEHSIKDISEYEFTQNKDIKDAPIRRLENHHTTSSSPQGSNHLNHQGTEESLNSYGFTTVPLNFLAAKNRKMSSVVPR